MAPHFLADLLHCIAFQRTEMNMFRFSSFCLLNKFNNDHHLIELEKNSLKNKNLHSERNFFLKKLQMFFFSASLPIKTHQMIATWQIQIKMKKKLPSRFFPPFPYLQLGINEML